MACLKAVTLSLVLVFWATGCDSARLSLVNQKTRTTADNQKVDCSQSVATVGVYDSSQRLLATMTPWRGSLGAAENYNYQNLSGNPIMGPKGNPSVATHFVYANQDGYFLNLILDKFYDLGDRATVTVHAQISGNQMRDAVVLSDEAGEMKLVDYDEGNQVTYFEGNFEYSKHSDGAVIGPLVGTSWEIRLHYGQANRIESMSFEDEIVGTKSFTMEDKSVSLVVLKPLTMNACDLPGLN
jgi:hypothetical protein